MKDIKPPPPTWRFTALGSSKRPPQACLRGCQALGRRARSCRTRLCPGTQGQSSPSQRPVYTADPSRHPPPRLRSLPGPGSEPRRLRSARLLCWARVQVSCSLFPWAGHFSEAENWVKSVQLLLICVNSSHQLKPIYSSISPSVIVDFAEENRLIPPAPSSCKGAQALSWHFIFSESIIK